jgi:hypothetical protein
VPSAGNTYTVAAWSTGSMRVERRPIFRMTSHSPGFQERPGASLASSHDLRTFVRFPASGYYTMGINMDQFRLTAATAGVQTLNSSLHESRHPVRANRHEYHPTAVRGALPLTP